MHFMQRPIRGFRTVLCMVSFGILGSVINCQMLTPQEETVLRRVWKAEQVDSCMTKVNDYATIRYGNPWDFEDGTTERISSFSDGIENPRVENGVLRFTMTRDKVLITWGAYLRTGKYATTEDINIEGGQEGWIGAKIRVRQTAPESRWRMETRQQGNSHLPDYQMKQGNAVLKGTDWQVLDVSVKKPADAFGISIEGPAGNDIQIDSVSIYTALYYGWYRKVFDLPAEKVQNAILNISRPGTVGEVFVNGASVYRTPEGQVDWGSFWKPQPVDIASFLKPGKNVIAVYGQRWGYPPKFMAQGAVNLMSGRQILLLTDSSWKWSGEEAPGWNRPGFDDSAWKQVQVRDLSSSYYAMVGSRPFYTGQVVVDNPYEKKLFYTDSRDVVFSVRIPAAYADEKPALSYRAESQMKNPVSTPKAGTVSRFSRSGDWIVYTVNIGRLPQGIYRASFDFRDPDDPALSRSEEFAVVGPIAQPKVFGTSYEEGMDVELVDRVDCADPKDPHPFYDAAGERGSRIVSSGAMTYRETSSELTYFSYALDFPEPHRPYLICVRYPDDRDRFMTFSMLDFKKRTAQWEAADRMLTYDTCTPGVITGGPGKFPHTGRMEELKFLYWANSGKAAIQIINRPWGGMDTRAAVSEILVYKVKQLPALDVPAGDRLFGLSLEWGDIIGSNFWTDYLTADTRFPNTHAEWFDTLVNYIRYLRFSGQNFVDMGTFMYTGPRYPKRRLVDDSSLEKDFRDLMLRMFEENGICMTALIQYVFSPALYDRYSPTDTEMAAGAETIWQVSRDGVQYKPASVFGQPDRTANPFHPEVQKDILRVVDELLDKFKAYPAFKGISFNVFPGVYGPSLGMDTWRNLANGPLNWGYDDTSIRLFEQDTGIRIPVDPKDPKRFGRRYDWLLANARESWIDWRCERMAKFYREIHAHVKKARPDLITLFKMEIYPVYVDRWLHKSGGQSIRDYMREMALDPSLLAGTKDLYVARFRDHLMSHGEPENFVGWVYATHPDVVRLYDREDSRGLMVFFPFLEVAAPQEKNPQPWPWAWKDNPDLRPSSIAWPVPGHMHYQEAYTRGMADSDPDLVVFGNVDSGIFMGHEQQMRCFARSFRTLPREKFCLLEGPAYDGNVRARELRSKDAYYFMLVNPGWWDATAQVVLSGLKKNDKVVDLASGRDISPDNTGTVALDLPAYAFRGYRVANPQARLISFRVVVPEETVRGYLQDRIETFRRVAEEKKAERVFNDTEWAFYRGRLAQAQELLSRRAWLECNDVVSDGEWNRLFTMKLAKATGGRPWYLIGPFPNDREGKGFRTAYPAEADVLSTGRPDLKKIYEGQGGTASWKKAWPGTREEAAYFDLDETFWPNDWVVAYAFTQVFSPKRQEAIISFGSDDGAKIWLNGREVYSKYEARPLKIGQERIPIILEEGANTLLVKIEEQIGGWGFSLAFQDAGGRPVSGLEYDPDSTAVGSYTMRMFNVAVNDITFNGRPLFTTEYFYFIGSDPNGHTYYPQISREELPYMRPERRTDATTTTYTWKGGVKGKIGNAFGPELVDLDAQVTAAPESIAMTYSVAPRETLGPGPWDPTFLYLAFVSRGSFLWQGKVSFETETGSKEMDLSKAPADGEWTGCVNRVRKVVFPTPEGPVTLAASSEDTGTAIDFYATSKPVAGKEPERLLTLSFRVSGDSKTWRMPKGYRNTIRLQITFPAGQDSAAR